MQKGQRDMVVVSIDISFLFGRKLGIYSNDSSIMATRFILPINNTCPVTSWKIPSKPAANLNLQPFQLVLEARLPSCVEHEMRTWVQGLCIGLW